MPFPNNLVNERDGKQPIKNSMAHNLQRLREIHQSATKLASYAKQVALREFSNKPMSEKQREELGRICELIQASVKKINEDSAFAPQENPPPPPPIVGELGSRASWQPTEKT